MNDPRVYLAIYSLGFFCVGLQSNSLGPLIPFLAERRNIPATQYSSLFLAVTTGVVVGISVYKFLQKRKYTHFQHVVLLVCCLIYVVTMAVFVLADRAMVDWIAMGVLGGCTYCMSTTLNICLLIISKHKAGVWISISHGTYGVGSLLAPQLIRHLQLNFYLYLAALFLIVAALCVYLPSPHDEMHPIPEQQFKKQQLVHGSTSLEVKMCWSFLLLVGIQASISGWFPSYAVLTGIADRNQATFYSTVFWGSVTLCRFLIGPISCTIQRKIQIMLGAVLGTSLICSLLQEMDMLHAGLIFGSFSFGASCSALFPLLLSVAGEHGIRFQPEQIANMMIASSLSAGLVTTLTGKLMAYKLQVLFYWLAVMSLWLALHCWAMFKQMVGQGAGLHLINVETQTLFTAPPEDT